MLTTEEMDAFEVEASEVVFTPALSFEERLFEALGGDVKKVCNKCGSVMRMADNRMSVHENSVNMFYYTVCDSCDVVESTDHTVQDLKKCFEILYDFAKVNDTPF